MVEQLLKPLEFKQEGRVLICNPEVFIFFSDYYIVKEILLKKKDAYSQFLDFTIFEYRDDEAMKLPILERKEKNILKWLAKNKDDDFDSILKSLLKTKDVEISKHSELTDLGKGIRNLVFNKSIQKVTFNTDNKIFINRLDKMFGGTLKIDFKVIDTKDIPDSDYDTIFIDDIDNILELCKKTKEVSYLVPQLGYNFEIVPARDDKEFMISKHQLEIEVPKTNNGISFIGIINMKEEITSVG